MQPIPHVQRRSTEGHQRDADVQGFRAVPAPRHSRSGASLSRGTVRATGTHEGYFGSADRALSGMFVAGMQGTAPLEDQALAAGGVWRMRSVREGDRVAGGSHAAFESDCVVRPFVRSMHGVREGDCVAEGSRATFETDYVVRPFVSRLAVLSTPGPVYPASRRRSAPPYCSGEERSSNGGRAALLLRNLA
jgi:hypothetical protein